MPFDEKPLRSVLYMPGNNRRAVEKARGLDVDAVILDLEDGIPTGEKAAARAAVADELAKGGFGHRLVAVRVNGLNSDWVRDDISALAGLPVDAILFPKIDGGADIDRAKRWMDQAGCPAKLAVWAMMESPAAILHAEEIAFSDPKLQCLIVGINDLAKDLHARQTPGRHALLTSLSIVVLAARAAGLQVVDGVFSDLGDPEGFEAECGQGLEMGFDGKTVVHPNQVEAANRIFGPSDEELAAARRIIEGFEAVRREGKGVAVVDGKMVEELHVQAAERLLRLAAIIGERQ